MAIYIASIIMSCTALIIGIIALTLGPGRDNPVQLFLKAIEEYERLKRYSANLEAERRGELRPLTMEEREFIRENGFEKFFEKINIGKE